MAFEREEKMGGGEGRKIVIGFLMCRQSQLINSIICILIECWMQLNHVPCSAFQEGGGGGGVWGVGLSFGRDPFT